MARSPLVLARLWSRFDAIAKRAVAATEAAAVLAELNQMQLEVETSAQAHDPGFADFLEMQTLGPLEAMLRQAGHELSLRQTLLALGLLLEPVPASGSSTLEKGLCLPLPSDPLYLSHVATLWIDLVSRFLTRGDFEVVLFLPNRPSPAPPTLEIGFSGGSPSTLQAALDPHVGRSVFVDLSKADWVEGRTQEDYAIKKLSSYLEQPQLSLRQAVATFNEAFLGG
jgi:type VI secretion system protein ImpM